MAGGRPTKCTPELLEKTRDYIDNYQDYDDLVPSVAGLSVEIGISRETAHKWRREEDKYPEFADMLIEMLSIQERKLLSGGLGGDMNSNITKLMLCKHGYSDKQETNFTGDLTTGVYELTDTERSARIATLLDRARERGAGPSDT